MKQPTFRILTSFTLFLLSFFPVKAEESRNFSSADGRKMEAKVLRVEGDQVTIIRKDNQQLTFAISSFSQADQQYLSNFSPGQSKGNWPQFFGPQGRGNVDDEVPVKWSSTENLAWKTNLPGKGSSSPVIWENRIFVTCFSGYGHSKENPGNMADLVRHLVCLDKSDGRILWKTDVPMGRNVSNYADFIAHHG